MRIPVLIAIVACFLLASCSTTRLPYIKGIDDVKVEKFTADSLQMNVALRINNPGTWGFRVRKINMDLTLNGKPIGSINGRLPIKRISKGERAYDVKVSTGSGAVMKALPDLLGVLSGKKLDLKLQGEMRVRWFIFSKRIKFDSIKDLKLPKMQGLGF